MSRINMRTAVIKAIEEEMTRDESVILMGLDNEHRGGAMGESAGLFKKFGKDRVLDTPIAESGYTGFANGAAMAGARPIVDFQFIDFASPGFDQVANQTPKMRYMSGGMLKFPIVYKALQGMGFGVGGQHSQCAENWFTNFPGLKIVVPTMPSDVKGLLKTSIRDDDPVLFIEHKMMLNYKEEVPDEEYTIPLGKARIAREGTDVTIVAWHMELMKSLAAADELEKEGISVEVIDPRTLIPFDKETVIESVKKTGRLIVSHEAPKRGGFAGEIIAMVADQAFEHLKAPVKRVCGLDVPIPFGTTEQFLMPSTERIIHEVKSVMGLTDEEFDYRTTQLAQSAKR